MTDAMLPVAVSLHEVTKHFGPIVALERTSLSVRTGTVHALLGENGAGKTTLVRIVFGMTRPDTGRMEVFGSSANWKSPADAIAAGVGMVHQHFTLVPAMTVAENVELGIGWSAGKSWLFDHQAAEAQVRVLARDSGLAVEPGSLVSELPVGAQQRVEIIKALRRNARVLILDEPTAVLTPQESDDLLRWLRSYVDNGGTVILITHKLQEALAIADEVTVLRRGRTVLSTERAGADETSLTRAMIGDDLAPPAVAPTRALPLSVKQGPVAVLDDVSATDNQRREYVRSITISIHAGEIVGVAGVEGAGQHTLLRVLAGRLRPTSGRVHLPHKVGFIPEDRQRDALLLDFSLAENVALRGAGRRQGRIRWRPIHARTAELLRDFDVRAASTSARIHTLSGGNQQRLILARELDGGPSLIVAENPTRGLDVRAASDVLNRLRAASNDGVAIVFYSSDLDEILGLASRVLVVHSGRVRQVSAEKEAVGRALVGLP